MLQFSSGKVEVTELSGRERSVNSTSYLSIVKVILSCYRRFQTLHLKHFNFLTSVGGQRSSCRYIIGQMG
jgi:hypothetical protein